MFEILEKRSLDRLQRLNTQGNPLFYKLKESGREEALFGLSLNKMSSVEGMTKVAKRIKGVRGENKFLESIDVWVYVKAPRYFWQDMDTYRLTTKQSQSTNHTTLKRGVEKSDFLWQDLPMGLDVYLNNLCKDNPLAFKRALPEGFLQGRMWKLNYSNIANIIVQRHNHKLPLVRAFACWLNFICDSDLLPDVKFNMEKSWAKEEESMGKPLKILTNLENLNE